MSDRVIHLAYGGADERAVPVHSASIFADRPHVRATIAEDAAAAGLRIAAAGAVAGLSGAGEAALGDIVLLDVPSLDAFGMAELARLDVRVAQSGTSLIVCTTISALDAVFGCLDQSNAQILVEPTRAERTLAIGRALLREGTRSVHELSEEDRITLLRLSQQVDEMARKLERLSGPVENGGDDPHGFRVESPALAFRHASEMGDRLVRASRPSLPDPRLVRRIIRQRQLRARFFDSELFSDPAWDMLLDLTAARAEHLRVSVTSLCIASSVPPTTALRWISQMTDMGLLQRLNDETDRRRAFIALTDKAADAMAKYFAEMGNSAVSLV